MESTGGQDRSSLIRAFHEARDAGDPGRLAAAALALPTDRGFGTHPGQVPALLHEAYVTQPADDSSAAVRARLATALARAWVYGGDADRAVAFARDARQLATVTGDAALVAASLDAALLVHWGPDDFAERLRLAAMLVDVASHVGDADAQMTAHLWRLTTAWECLDIVAVGRQLRALDLLASETGSTRIAFFAASRRAMCALVVGTEREVDELVEVTGALGEALAEPDVEAVTHSLVSERARRARDVPTLLAEAAGFEGFGAAEGIPSVLAQSAVLWWEGGEPERAGDVVDRVAGGSLSSVERDVDYLLTVSAVAVVAAGTGRSDLAHEAAGLLEPYAGRAVLNAGAVTFHGVVDDAIHRARRAAGGDGSRWADSAAAMYRRIGAGWWADRLSTESPLQRAPGAAAGRVVAFRREGTGMWSIGDAAAPFVLPDLKGLHHLAHLLARPGREIAALDLSDAAAGHPGAGIDEAALGPTLDRSAVAAYRARLADLDDELEEAERWSDSARAERAVTEREALLDELKGISGLGGRDRRPGASDERARLAVRKAITAAISRIGEQDPALDRLLRDTVHTGRSCRFEPDPGRPVDWVLA